MDGLAYDDRPARLSAARLVLSVPGLAAQFRKIPPQFWEHHCEGKARIQCPCANRPVLRVGELRECRENASAPHKCQRVFCFLGPSVLVTGGPKQAA